MGASSTTRMPGQRSLTQLFNDVAVRQRSHPDDVPSIDSQARKRPVSVYVLAIVAVLVTTGILALVQHFVGQHEHGRNVRPFGIGFIIPVVLITLLGGRKPGIMTLLLSVAALLTFLMGHEVELLSAANIGEISVMACVGAMVIGLLDIGVQNRDLNRNIVSLHQDMESTRSDLAHAKELLVESEARRLDFNREVLLAVTGGKLLLSEQSEVEQLTVGEPDLVYTLKQYSDVSTFRQELLALIAARDMKQKVRVDDLVLATMEATANALKHGNGGIAKLWLNADQATVVVSDHGEGIPPTHMARTLLEHGFSSQSSLGMGFTLMLQSVDLLALSSAPSGTDVLLRVTGKPRMTPEEEILSRYPSL